MGLTQKLGTIPLAILTDASNNVGIGAAPSGSYKLEVTGTAKVSSTLSVPSSTGIVLGTTGSTDGIISSVSGSVGLRLRINTTDALVIASTGASTFSGSISVNPTTNGFITLGATANYGSVSSGGGGITFYMNGATRGGTTTAGSGVGVIATDADFYFTNSAVNSTKALISSAGFLGIGTSAPLKILHLAKGGNVNGILFTDDASGNYRNEINNEFSGGAAASNLMTFKVCNTTTTGQVTVMTLKGNSDATFSQNLAIAGIINVGSGYNTPNAFTIQSDTNWAFGCFSNNTTQYWMQSRFYGDGTDNRGFRVVNMDGGAVVFRVNSVGNYAFTGVNISDKRMKENINYVTSNQLATILKLKPATYNQKDTEGNINENIHTGFIAQDVLAENIPNLVMGNEEGGYGLDYNGILSLAVKAIQELNERLNKAGL